MKQRNKVPILILAALVAILPLIFCQCSKKPEGPIRGLSRKEAARLAEAHDPWGKRKPLAAGEIKTLPPDRLEALGDLALENRDFESSMLNFLQILATNPERDDIRYKVGVILLMTGQLEAARNELAQVLVRKPEMVQAHEAMGLVHLQEKKYPQAMEEFQLVLSQDPKRPNTRHLLGVTYLEAGQTQRAVSELKRALELNPRQLSSYIALGQAYNQMKDYKQALSYLRKARELAPQNEKVNYQMGMAYAGLKQHSEALEAFMKAGDEAQAYNNIGVHYYMAGQYEEAAKCFQRAIELRPTFYQEARNNLQKALEKLHESGKDGS